MAHEESLRRVVKIRCYLLWFLALTLALACIIIGLIVTKGTQHKSNRTPVPIVYLASMSVNVVNITETRLDATWSFAISIPSKRDLEVIPNKHLGYYICHQGDFQASFTYKNVTLFTSLPTEYKNLHDDEPQILTDQIDADLLIFPKKFTDLIGIDLVEDIKEKKEVKLGLLFTLSDCKQKRTARIRYACDEVTLRFKQGWEMQAEVNDGKCVLQPPKMH